MGINTTRTKLLAFSSSALWAGLAGVVPAVHRGSIHPETYDFNMSVLFVAMAVLGGLGSTAGAIVGAALLWMIPSILQESFPQVQEYRFVFFGALMAAMMVVRPEGLLGGARRRGAAA
jgi:branched-chain amino acid transport system permease protein